ncbi:MAG: hypothetical protein Q8N35_15400 [Methylococcaceae bacterium]|nr:hypothetical protein [Methylococcaceae bacterium]MDZ4154995.1 hypothetical protein [Methylococcales bacterium]MDP2393387.1 hypothetical protein [Methylococcaceae bacterium]MDP3020965.1 hypothetical protein [Methylococcaceae bacterium]MDP3392029.1 hypothetical protein [Methylococcaceae bacterium]
MDSAFLSLIILIGIGIFFLLGMFILPYRKLPEENIQPTIHTERCSAYWRAFGGALLSGGILPARISFYADFFVVARMTLAKVAYSEIKSATFKRGWLSNSVTLNFGKGRSLFFTPKNVDKVQSLIESKMR